MHEPLVSIIIPCWNAVTYIGDAIESALVQTYPKVEAIVIDDGSTDASLEVIKSFGDRIRWESGPNRGACAARNRGVALAAGKLIQFLDADDLLYPNKLAEQVPLSLAFPSEVVYCDWETVVGDASDRRISAFECAGLDSVVYALTYQIATPTPLHWKATLGRVGGFRESLPCAQERDLHIRLACYGIKFHHLPKVLCTIRRRAHGLSSDGIRVLDQHLGIVLGAKEILERRGELTSARAAALASLLARDARHYLRNGKQRQAKEYFRAARGLHQGGGLAAAYGTTTRVLRCCCGPVLAELLVGLGRRLRSFAISTALGRVSRPG